MKSLTDILNEKVDDNAKDNNQRKLFSNVYISRGALKKAFAYARLVCDVYGEKVECYGYLINPKDKKDRIVRDIYLAPEQDVSSSGVKIMGESVIESGRDIDKMGYKILGWWHSDASFDTFHSGTDDENMLSVLNSIAPINYRVRYHRKRLLNGNLGTKISENSIEIFEKDKRNKKLILNLSEGNGELKRFIADSLVHNMQSRTGFAYSIVVNALGSKPYAEIATRNLCNLCYSEQDESKEAGLRIVRVNDDISFNEKTLKKEIKEKIMKPHILPVYLGFLKDPNKDFEGSFEDVEDPFKDFDDEQ